MLSCSTNWSVPIDWLAALRNASLLCVWSGCFSSAPKTRQLSVKAKCNIIHAPDVIHALRSLEDGASGETCACVRVQCCSNTDSQTHGSTIQKSDSFNAPSSVNPSGPKVPRSVPPKKMSCEQKQARSFRSIAASFLSSVQRVYVS